ncbi:MAG TPA: hypothetical protein VJ650_00210 [Gemmatimonadaceae bacterium]|nr:hypothetical protein [Gemmatimonadaceae bacterium]
MLLWIAPGAAAGMVARYADDRPGRRLGLDVGLSVLALIGGATTARATSS